MAFKVQGSRFKDKRQKTKVKRQSIFATTFKSLCWSKEASVDEESKRQK